MPFFGGANLPDLPNIDAQLNLFTRLLDEFGREAERRRAVIEPLETEFLSSIRQLVDTYAPHIKQRLDFAREVQDLYQRVGLPAEQRFARQLEEYDTPSRRSFEAARASEEVTRNASALELARRQELARSGVDPNDPRYAGMQVMQQNDTAARAAAASRAARERVEDRGIQQRQLATNIRRGWADAGASALSAGTQLAAQIPTATGMGYQTAATIGGRPMDWQNAQLGLADQYIRTLMERYNAKMGRAAARSSAQAGLGGALGTLFGAGLGYFLPGGNLNTALLGGRLFGPAGGGFGGGGDY